MKDGPIFAVEIDLIGENGYPSISLSRFTFDFSFWDRMSSVSDHWLFYYPFVEDENLFTISELNGVWTSIPKEHIKKKYWGFEKAIAIEIKLMDVDSPETIRSKVFGELMELNNHT